jgi:LacI family transcriptional regulator
MARRVRASASELGYVANAQAQALARSATGLVGLVVHDIVDPYFATITRGAQRHAGARHSQVLLAGADRNEAAELAAVAPFVAYRADAIILAGSRRAQPDDRLAAELARYIRSGGRVVTLGPSTIPGARYLDVKNRTAAARLVAALVERGMTEFAILAGPPDLNTARRRVEGYRDALAAAGLRPLRVVHGDFNREGGRASAVACWQRLTTRRRPGRGTGHGTPRPCLLAVNDVMALGAIAGLGSIGVSVPDDAQVAGFDDIPTLLDFRPALTTVRLPLERMGEQAAELALAPSADGPVEIDGEVMLRDSAG